MTAGDAATRAAGAVDAVADDPRRRRALAVAFYGTPTKVGSAWRFRRAELAFTDWQIRRGVLAPVTGSPPGSRWWRAVNARLLCDTREAQLLARGVRGCPSHPAVVRWLEFLSRPTPASWYRAHNTSISSAYLEARPLAGGEQLLERFFMDVTLARVLFVQSMIMSPGLALGRYLQGVGRYASDPRSRGVEGYLSLRHVLPDAYPLRERSVTDVLDAENFWGRLVDYGLVMPRLPEIYAFAAADLGHDHLHEWLTEGRPTYAWPTDRPEVWTQRRYRRLGAAVRRVVGARRRDTNPATAEHRPPSPPDGDAEARTTTRTGIGDGPKEEG